MITPISYKINSYTSNKQSKVQRVGCSNIKTDSVTFSGFNPTRKLANILLSRSISSSKKRIMPIRPELKDLTKEIILTAKDKQKFPTLVVQNKDAKKCVVFYHGLRQNITFNQHLYSEFNKKGFTVIAPEYGGFGKSINSAMTPKSIKNNTEAVYEYAKSLGFSDKNIGIVSFSLGSIPATEFAKNHKGLRFLIMSSPFNSVSHEKDFILHGKSYNFPKIVKKAINRFPQILSWVDNIFNAGRNIEKIKGTPIHLIQPKNDPVVSIASTDALSKQAENLASYLQISGEHSINVESFASILK